MIEPQIFARAAALGIKPPTFTEAQRPQLFEAWRDRVLQAESDVERGVDPAPMIREAAIYGGHDVPPLPIDGPPGRRPSLLDKQATPIEPAALDELRAKMEAMVRDDPA